MRQQDAYRHTGKTMCSTSTPHSNGNVSLIVWFSYLLDSTGREWCLRQASKSNFGLVFPWPLTSWPPWLTVHALSRGGGDSCQFAMNSLHSFSEHRVHSLVITDERTLQMDQRTGREQEHKNSICIAFMCFYDVQAFCRR